MFKHFSMQISSLYSDLLEHWKMSIFNKHMAYQELWFISSFQEMAYSSRTEINDTPVCWILSFTLGCHLILSKYGKVRVVGWTIIARIGAWQQASMDQILGIAKSTVSEIPEVWELWQNLKLPFKKCTHLIFATAKVKRVQPSQRH